VEDQLWGHPGYDLQGGLDTDKARLRLDCLSDGAAVGGGCVHSSSLSVRGPRIKPRASESVTANIIALLSTTATRE
jgi:hypothetical protein